MPAINRFYAKFRQGLGSGCSPAYRAREIRQDGQAGDMRLEECGTILVTGASGFVGAAVLRALSGRGVKLRALLRAQSPRENVQGLEVEIAPGDLRDAAAVRQAMDGIDGLFHVAADYRLWAPDPEEIVRNNLLTTKNVMEAALATGVRRIVYTSSVATLKPGERDHPGDETGPLSEDTAIGAYKRSKVLAERLVEAMVTKNGLPATIVNPSTPIGPGDIKPTPTGRVIVEAATGRIPVFVDTGLNLVHVDDCANGHLLAFEKGKVGERYILGGDDVDLSDMLTAIAEITGGKPPLGRIPRQAIFPLAVIAEALAKLTGKEPLVTVDALRMAKYRMFFSSAKARRELGYQARPHRQALSDAIAYFRQRGMIA